MLGLPPAVERGFGRPCGPAGHAAARSRDCRRTPPILIMSTKSVDLLGIGGQGMGDERLIEEEAYFAVREEQLVRRLERAGHARRSLGRRGAGGAMGLGGGGL